MTNAPLTLSLTTDELLAVLQVMGASTMNGLGEPLAGLSERDQAARLNAGAETLLNRGLCRIENDQLVIDDTMAAFIGACLIPDAVLLLSAIEPNQSNDPHYFNATPYIAVEHMSPRLGVHLFMHLPTVETLKNRVEAMLAPVAVDTSRAAQPETWTLPDAQLNAALVAVRAGRGDEARRIFGAQGWSGQALDDLVDDLSTASSWVGLAGWGLREPTPANGTSVILYAGRQRYWLFSPLADAEGQLMVSSPNGKGCVDAFLHLIQPLQRLIEQSQ